MTSSAAMVVLGAAAAIALVAACVAILWALAARRAASRIEIQHRESVELVRSLEGAGRLAADIVHDLNDLLTAITGDTELLIVGLDPAGASIQDAREILRAATNAAGLTRSLRSLGGGHRASTDVTDVNGAIARTAGFLERMPGPRMDVALALDSRIKRIRISAGRLEAIVLTLGVHARDGMPDGGRLTIATTMHARARRHDGGGPAADFVRLVVADTGGGRGASPARAAELVNEAGGYMQVETVPGVGTTVTVDLPATSDAAPAPGSGTGAAPSLAPVLVVEDEPGVREMIRVVLARAGHEVIAVDGPHAALAALSRRPAISLMIVDLVMPEMDGYDLVEEARKTMPGVLVVFMSGFAPDASRHRGADRFLAKPFSVDSLTDVVRDALAASPVTTPSAIPAPAAGS